MTTKQTGKSVVLSHRVSVEEYRVIAELAKQEDRTVHNMVLHIIRMYLREKEAPDA